MRIGRCLTIGLAALGALSGASAELTGPIPLAWRWAHSTTVAPLGTPLVSGDTVYVAVGQRIFALDRVTGNQKWRYPQVEGVPGYFRAGPVLSEGSVIAAADNRLLYACDAEKGTPKWQWAAPAPIVGQPVVVAGVVVVRLSDSSLMGIRADNGEPEWKTPQGDPAPYKVFDGINGDLAVHGTTIIFMTQSGQLTGLSATTRKQLWKAKFSNVTPESTPIVMGDVVYVNSGSWLVAVNALSGAGRWQQNIGDPLTFSPAVSPDGVFAVTEDGKAVVLNPMTGGPKLKQPVDLKSVLAVRPSAVDKLFLAPLTNGALTFINPATGEVAWNYYIRPLFKGMATSTTSGGGPGSGLGGVGPGGGGRGGGGLGGGQGGNRPGGGGGGTSQSSTAVIAVPASGPAVLVGQTLLVLVQDGSLLAFDPDMGVDKTGPTIKMVWPNPGEQVSGRPPLELIFKIEDEATGVSDKTVKVEIEGKPYEFEFGRDGYAIVRFSDFTKNRPLSDGRKTLKVSASDWIGNASASEFGLTIDNALKPLSRDPNVGPGANQGNRPGGGGGGRGGGGAGGGGIG